MLDQPLVFPVCAHDLLLAGWQVRGGNRPHAAFKLVHALARLVILRVQSVLVVRLAVVDSVDVLD